MLYDILTLRCIIKASMRYLRSILSLFLLASSPSIAHAQTSCLLFPSGSTPPSGYGASWDVTTPGKELLIRSNCPTRGNALDITVGKGNTAQFIWSKIYAYNAAVTPPRWDPYILAGTIDANGWVTSGSGTKTITMPFNPTAANPLYFVGYVCAYHSSAWKCGCANSACTTRHWQLQGNEGIGGGTTSGSTGGGTGIAPSGEGIGVALAVGGPGNHRFTDSVSKTILLEKVDSPLTAVQWNNRHDHAGGRVGYSTGNGGEISIRARKVTSIGGGRMSLGEIIGETDRVQNPTIPSSWAVHWQREDGSGSMERFNEFPTLRFKTPIDLAAKGLRVGDHLAFEFVQHNPSSGTVSINVAHSDPLALGTLRGFSRVMSEYRVFRSNGQERTEKVSLLLVGYADGTVVGNPWMFCTCSSGEYFDIGGSKRLRQVIPVTESGKSAKSLRTLAGRPSSSTASPLKIELREAGANPGSASDEGTLLCSGTVPASGTTQIPSSSSMKHDSFAYKDQEIICPTAVPLVKGKTYYVEVSSDSTPYRFMRMLRYTAIPNAGLRQPTFITSNFTGQENTGSGWRDMEGFNGVDAPLWISF